MERKNVLNSPHIVNSPSLRNTPVKRLGLSNKRKSLLSSNDKHIRNCNGTPGNSNTGLGGKERLQKMENEVTMETVNGSEDSKIENIDYEIITNIRKKILLKEKKVQSLENTRHKINELNVLLEQWKIGLKEALCYFSQIVNERKLINCSMKEVLMQLGVWQTVNDNFENDSELMDEYDD